MLPGDFAEDNLQTEIGRILFLHQLTYFGWQQLSEIITESHVLFFVALFALWIGSARAEVFEFAIVGDAGTWNSSAEMVVSRFRRLKSKI